MTSLIHTCTTQIILLFWSQNTLKRAATHCNTMQHMQHLQVIPPMPTPPPVSIFGCLANEVQGREKDSIGGGAGGGPAAGVVGGGGGGREGGNGKRGISNQRLRLFR